MLKIVLEWFVKTDFIDATRCLLVVVMYAVTGAAVLKEVELPEFWTSAFGMVTLFYLGTEAIDQVKKLRSGKSSRDGNSSNSSMDSADSSPTPGSDSGSSHADNRAQLRRSPSELHQRERERRGQ